MVVGAKPPLGVPGLEGGLPGAIDHASFIPKVDE